MRMASAAVVAALVLAAWLLASLAQWQRQVRTTLVLRHVAEELIEYREREGGLPESVDHLEGGARLDGWGRPFLYERRGSEFVLYSRGRDGTEGSAFDPWRLRTDDRRVNVCWDYDAELATSDLAFQDKLALPVGTHQHCFPH